MRRYLEGRGLWEDSIDVEARAHAAHLRTNLRDGVFGAPDPDPLELFDQVFAVPTPELLAQRAELDAELQRGA